jgi:DNA-binding transcriptional ArsR family regulator
MSRTKEESRPVSGDPVNEQPDPANIAAASLSRLVNNTWRPRILAEVLKRDISPSRFVAEIGGEISTISRHFRWLEETGSIEVAREETGGRRRGATERIFRSSQPARLGTPEWLQLPLAHRELWSRNSVAIYFCRIAEAIGARTFDAQDDRHFSWDAVTLDDHAWKEVGERLTDTLNWLRRLEAESERRLEESGGQAILTTVGLAAFRSPADSGWRGSSSDNLEGLIS